MPSSLITLLTPCLFVFTAITQAQDLDPAYFYRLTTAWQGEGKSLDIVSDAQNNKPILAASGNTAGQNWKLTPLGNGFYRLSTQGQGEGKSLDIVNDGQNNKPILAASGNYSGQMWKLTALGNGFYRLTTQWQGDGKSLDIINDGQNNKPILAASGNYSGQMWKLTKLGPVASAGPSVQLNIGTAPLATPTPAPQTVQMIEGPTTVISGAPAPATSYSNLQATPRPAVIPMLLQSGNPPAVIPGVKCIDFSLTGSCGSDKADKLGSYSLNMKCDEGFYDPIWGGTCWKCPDDDGSGAFIRSANKIQDSDACWRVPKEKTGPATRVKNTAWAWECPGGTFWDGYDWGACWKCPDAFPRRTGHPVYSGDACATPVNETKPAIFLKFNGCPDPQQALASGTVTADGRRMPGRPFLDVGAGWAQGQASGLCYACPVVDRDGYFLITDRSASAVTAGDACAIRMKYGPAPFAEPGMAGLGTVALIQEKQVLDPAGFTRELYRQAAANGIEQPTAFVGEQWADVAARPSTNTYLRVAVFNRLLEAAQTPAASRSPAQQAAVAAMEKYIHDKRVYVAQVALDMYKAWKAKSDEWNATHKQSPIAQLFDYGTVPLDFLGMAAAVLAPASATSAMLVAGAMSAQWTAGALAAAKDVADTAYTAAPLSQVASPLQMASEGKAATPLMIKVANEVKAASTAKATTDALRAALSARIVATLAVGAIEIATTIIAAVAMDQFMSIVTAQSKLEGALSTAKAQRANLGTLVSTSGGIDELRWHFAQAVGNAPVLPEAPVLLALAQAGNAKAAATGYAVPK